MTTGPAAAEPSSDRRRAAPASRVSWASPIPFSLGPDVELQQVVKLAEARRGAWTGGLWRRLLCTDVAIAGVVMAACVFSMPQTRQWTAVGGVAAAVVWAGVLALLGGYDRRRVGDGPEEYEKVFQAAVLVIAGLGLLSYSLQLVLPRRDVLIAVPLTALLTLLGRYTWRRWLHRRRAEGSAMLRTLLVGERSAVSDVLHQLRRQTHHGLVVVGACLPSAREGAGEIDGVPLMGVLSEVPQVVVDNEVDNVVVVGSQIAGHSLRRLSWALEDTGADLMVAPGLVEVTGAYVSLHPAAGMSLLRVERPSQRSGRLLAKNVQDRLLGGVMLLVALPVVLAAALAVRLSSPGGAFYGQARVGRDGQPFSMWKLRSMVADAEQRIADFSQENDRDGLAFKMRRDPRVTPVGRWLRRYSVDELPQLWNVVRGDMSLVGPRPPLPREYALYHDAVHRRLRVKPGLTGLWQVSGRADLPWEESVRLDLRYVDNWSPAMDMQILWKTLRAVVGGSGAY